MTNHLTLRAAAGALFTAALLAAAGTAGAQSIVGATGVTASAGLPSGYSAPTALGNIIDQSGLSANYVSGVTDFATFTGSTTACYACTPGGGYYSELGGVAAGNDLGSITFDLGSAMSIDSIVVWNQAGSASLVSFDLVANGASLGSFTMGSNSQDFPAPAQVFSFGAVSTQFVTMNITANAGYYGGTIMNEVAFEAVAAVPEPETYAMMLAGLGALGWVGRRRARQAAQA